MKVPASAFIAAAALSVAALSGCREEKSPAQTRIEQGESRTTIAQEAREEIYGIVGDYHSLRSPDSPIILMSDMIEPNDITKNHIIIDLDNLDSQKLAALSDAVLEVSGTFARMRWDRDNPGVDPVYSEKEIALAGKDIDLGADLAQRLRLAMDKARVSGLIPQQQLSSAGPVPAP